jgi:hypothetical protein
VRIGRVLMGAALLALGLVVAAAGLQRCGI